MTSPIEPTVWRCSNIAASLCFLGRDQDKSKTVFFSFLSEHLKPNAVEILDTTIKSEETDFA